MQAGVGNAEAPEGDGAAGGNENQTRVFVRSEPHAALGEIATRLLSMTSPPSDMDIEHTMREVQELEQEVGLVTARVSHAYTGLVHVFEMKGCYEEALQCLHKSRVVLSQCYEDKGKFLPHQVRRGFEILEDKFTKAIERGGAGEVCNQSQ